MADRRAGTEHIRGLGGRIAALEKGGRRVTLETGGMRVTVAAEDLVPAVEPVSRAGSDGGGEAPSNIGALRLGRARAVASSLDLRGARVEEALETLDRYSTTPRWREWAV